MNSRGKGKAYFIAARTGKDFLDDFYRTVTDEAGVKRILSKKLPQGVSAQVRTDGKTDFVFLLNFTPHVAKVDCGALGLKKLGPFENLVFERPSVM
jgi:beta-galactosidase